MVSKSRLSSAKPNSSSSSSGVTAAVPLLARSLATCRRGRYAVIYERRAAADNENAYHYTPASYYQAAETLGGFVGAMHGASVHLSISSRNTFAPQTLGTLKYSTQVAVHVPREQSLTELESDHAFGIHDVSSSRI